MRGSERTIRYYEELGILPEPRRSPGGTRKYPREYQGYIETALALKDLGFRLEEIKPLARLALGRSVSAGQRDNAARMVEDRIEALAGRSTSCAGYANRCAAPARAASAPLCALPQPQRQRATSEFLAYARGKKTPGRAAVTEGLILLGFLAVLVARSSSGPGAAWAWPRPARPGR